MTQRIEKIEQELVKLEGAIAQISQQLLAVYSPYLKLLGKTIHRQLIMAVYQVCTDVYPESFLKLSLNQRVNLQTKIKHIAQGIMGQLLTPLADLKNIIASSISVDKVSDADPEKIENVEKVETTEKLPQVRQLVNWQRQTEIEVGQLLQQGSKEVNNFLHQTGLLAQQLPIALLEAAANVESLNTAAVISRPNTLNLLVETEDTTESEVEEILQNISQNISQSISQSISHNISFKESAKEPLRLTAIYLRLGDLEFNEPELGNTSNNVRALVTKLYALDREYHKQSKHYQIAQAQAAWRSTWTED